MLSIPSRTISMGKSSCDIWESNVMFVRAFWKCNQPRHRFLILSWLYNHNQLINLASSRDFHAISLITPGSTGNTLSSASIDLPTYSKCLPVMATKKEWVPWRGAAIDITKSTIRAHCKRSRKWVQFNCQVLCYATHLFEAFQILNTL